MLLHVAVVSVADFVTIAVMSSLPSRIASVVF